MSYVHEKTWACDFWRPCCCHRGDDGHCWGCGASRDEHKDGEGFVTARPESPLKEVPPCKDPEERKEVT